MALEGCLRGGDLIGEKQETHELDDLLLHYGVKGMK